VPLTFGATAVADRDTARLIPVNGNNQRGLPGDILEPLVVRLEDQFGNPLPGEVVRAEILRGTVEFVAGGTRETDANGQAQFLVQVTTIPSIAVVAVTVPALPQVAPVRFLVNRPRFAVGRSPQAVAVGDFDGDDVLDVVTANRDSDNVSMLRGRGDGTFEAAAHFVAGTGPQAVAVGDFDGDDVLDVVTANAFSHDISMLRGQGDGTFAPAVPFAVGTFPQAVAVGDFDGDDVLDVVTANGGSDDISMLRGRGDGTFAATVHLVVRVGPTAVAVADVNGDRALDVVTANALSADVSILLGLGDGAFE
jgi:hypothetical protein